MKTNEEKIKAAALLATKAKLLQVEEPGYIEAEGLEKTWKFQQEDIAKQVPLASAYKVTFVVMSFSCHHYPVPAHVATQAFVFRCC